MLGSQSEKKTRVLQVRKVRGHKLGTIYFEASCDYSKKLLSMVRRRNFDKDFINFLVELGMQFELDTREQDKKDDAYIDKKLEKKGYANVIKFKEVSLFGKSNYYQPLSEVSKRVCEVFGRKTLTREQVEMLEYIQNVTARNLVKDELNTLLKEAKKEKSDERKEQKEQYLAYKERYANRYDR